MTTAKLGRRGQITLPRDVREHLGLTEGQRVAFVFKGDEVTLHPLTRGLRQLRGSVHVDVPQDFEQIREAVKRSRAVLETNG
jgi:AbrB family looped-hinge helix DNA binding protein